MFVITGENKMVAAELRYNPYLSEITIKFNGRDPHINSLVYKHQNEHLEDWINKLPEIFRDEMNGYDFRLEVSGTRLDYEELQSVFRAQGISEKSVPCVLVRELEGREIKLREIRELFTWLESNPNRTFDYAAFKQDNPDLLEIMYSMILLHGAAQDTAVPRITGMHTENVAAMSELDGVDLNNIPLVYIVNDEAAENIHEDMQYLLGRSDFVQRQLFFIVDSAASVERIHKFLKDCGIEEPVIITSLDAESLEKYCRLYPITEYICNVLAGLRQEVSVLQNAEQIKREAHETANRGIYERIEEIDDQIARLKTALGEFQEEQMPIIPSEWERLEKEVLDGISKWKSTKVKTTSEKEALQSAQELSSRMAAGYYTYINKLKIEAQIWLGRRQAHCREIYQRGEEDLTYVPNLSPVTFGESAEIPNIISALMELRSEEWVVPNDDLFGKLFKQQNQADRTPMLERTYTYQQWRSYTLGIISPIIAEVKKNWFQCVAEGLAECRQQYEEHLAALIEQCIWERAQINSQLSDDEQLFQADINWLAAFDEQLTRIERG